jgi:hypothetical protein
MRNSTLKKIALKDIHIPRNRRHVLTPIQRARVATIVEAFQEVFPTTLDEAVYNFERDMNPEGEILVWEGFLRTWRKRSPECKTAEERKALYMKILDSGPPLDLIQYPRSN